ncbi:MAG: metal ABC transporter permease [Pseudomonadota bacterium]
MTWIETLALPFRFPFMVSAFQISLALAVPAALLSCFLVLKGWSLMGDAISHAVLPGIILATLAGIPVVIGAFVSGMLCALLTGFIDDNSRVKRDTVMGVVFSGMFAIGLVLHTQVQAAVHIDHILFGNMLGVGPDDLMLTGTIALIVSAVVVVFARDLLLHAFDAVHARVMNLSVNAIHYGLLIMLSLTIVAALKAVGIILTIALLIAPGAIAFLVTRRFNTMLLVAVLVSTTSSFVGVYLSFFLDSAPAPTIVLVMSGLFIIAFILTTWRARNEEARLDTVPDTAQDV